MEKTGDSMFDEIVETRMGADGKLEASLAPDAEEIEEAVAEMVKAYRDFRDILAEGSAVAHEYRWWKSLCWLACAEDRLKTAFLGGVGGDRSPASMKLYHRWRSKMVFGGKRYRVDA